jgi:hypothetical protein
LGIVSLVVSTSSPNNDDAPGNGSDNNLVAPLKRFDSTGFIDVEMTVTPTQGVSAYLVSEFVDNNTGINWSAYTMLLGFGTGAGFTSSGAIADANAAVPEPTTLMIRTIGAASSCLRRRWAAST